MESNLIVWSLKQLKIGLWEDMRLLLGNTGVQNQWKYTLLAESSPFRCLYFRSISMAVLGNRYDSHEKNRKYKLQDKKSWEEIVIKIREPFSWSFIANVEAEDR